MNQQQNPIHTGLPKGKATPKEFSVAFGAFLVFVFASSSVLGAAAAVGVWTYRGVLGALSR